MYKNVTVISRKMDLIYRSTPCSDDVMASASKGTTLTYDLDNQT